MSLPQHLQVPSKSLLTALSNDSTLQRGTYREDAMDNHCKWCGVRRFVLKVACTDRLKLILHVLGWKDVAFGLRGGCGPLVCCPCWANAWEDCLSGEPDCVCSSEGTIFMQVGARPLSTRPSRRRPICSYDCSTDEAQQRYRNTVGGQGQVCVCMEAISVIRPNKTEESESAQCMA